MSLSLRGRRLDEVLRGERVVVSETMMAELCHDLAALTPPRYARTGTSRSGGLWLELVGAPVFPDRSGTNRGTSPYTDEQVGPESGR